MDELAGQSELVDILADFVGGDAGVKNVVLQVMAIDRYLIDATNQHVAFDGSVNYLYDLTVTDGKSSVKTLLNSNLSHLVQSNQLKRSSVCLMALEEEHLDRKPFLIIKRLRVLSCNSKPMGDIKYCLGSETLDSEASLESFVLPITGVRHFFVNVWNDAIVEWPLTNPDDDPYIPQRDFSEKITNLMKKCENWSLKEIEICKGKPRHFLPLIVRVISAGKLTHLSKDRDQTMCSFRGTYVVTDGSAVSYLSVWDSVVASLFNKIQINSILLIQNYYTDKYKGKINTKFTNVHKGGSKLSLTSFEIKVNAKSDASVEKSGHSLYVFQPGDERLLPELPYTGFVFFNSFNNLDPKATLMFDIAGIVVSLSRYERITRYDFNSQKMNGVWVVRWIEIAHWPNKPPLTLQVFVNGQLDSHYELRVGCRVVISNMRVVLGTESNNYCKNYFTSTNETQLIILSQLNWQQLAIFRELRSLYETSQESIDECVKFGNGVGGNYPFLSIPGNTDELKEPFYQKTDSSQLWLHIIDNLWFWLSKRVIIEGKIAEISFIGLNKGEEMANVQSLRIYKNDTIVLDELKLHGLAKPHRNTFPQKCSENNCRPFQFPVTSYLTNISKYKEEIPAVDDEPDFVCNGYYEIIIADGENAIKCFFGPEPAQRPFPSLKQTLMRQFTPVEQETRERIDYSEEEVNVCAQTAHQVAEDGEQQTFVVELFKHSAEECEVILRRMYASSSSVDCGATLGGTSTSPEELQLGDPSEMEVDND